MKIYTIILPFALAAIGIVACHHDDHVQKEESNRVSIEVMKTLQNYFTDINKDGPLAELKYLDSTALFSWYPPGFNGPIDFDSVKTILIQNAAAGNKSVVLWDSLEIFPVTKFKAKYAGKITVISIQSTGKKDTIHLSEEGNLIRREDGWKLLSGKTVIRNQ